MSRVAPLGADLLGAVCFLNTLVSALPIFEGGGNEGDRLAVADLAHGDVEVAVERAARLVDHAGDALDALHGIDETGSGGGGRRLLWRLR